MSQACHKNTAKSDRQRFGSQSNKLALHRLPWSNIHDRMLEMMPVEKPLPVRLSWGE